MYLIVFLLVSACLTFYILPSPLIVVVETLFPDVLFRVETIDKVIALTIDDSPYPITTRSILDILEIFNCKATFFLIGEQIEGSQIDDVKEILNKGHEIGNHAWNHGPSVFLNEEELENQILATEERMNMTGWRKETPTKYKRNLFRPASGIFGNTIRTISTKHGYDVTLGSIYPHDAHITNVDINVAYIIKKIKSGDILIIHDRENTPQLLKRILPKLLENGYQVTTVTNMLEIAENATN